MSHPPVEIRVPPFGQGLEEILLVAWTTEPGQALQRGDPVAEVETAKSSNEIVADREGVVQCLLAEPGAILKVGAPLYLLTVSQ